MRPNGNQSYFPLQTVRYLLESDRFFACCQAHGHAIANKFMKFELDCSAMASTVVFLSSAICSAT